MTHHFCRIFCAIALLVKLCIGNAYGAEVNSAQFWFGNTDKWQMHVKEIGTVTVYPEKHVISVNFPQLVLRSQSDDFEVCSLTLVVAKQTPDGWRDTEVKSSRAFSKKFSRGESFAFPEPVPFVINVPPGFDVSDARLSLEIDYVYKGECAGYIPVPAGPLSAALTLKQFPQASPVATKQSADPRPRVATESALSPERRAAKEFIESALLSCNTYSTIKRVAIEGAVLSTKELFRETGRTYNASIDLSSTTTGIMTNHEGIEGVRIECENPGCATWSGDDVRNAEVYFCGRFNARIKKAIDVYKAGLPSQKSAF